MGLEQGWEVCWSWPLSRGRAVEGSSRGQWVTGAREPKVEGIPLCGGCLVHGDPIARCRTNVGSGALSCEGEGAWQGYPRGGVMAPPYALCVPTQQGSLPRALHPTPHLRVWGARCGK